MNYCKLFYLGTLLLIAKNINAQIQLMPVQPFHSNVLVTGTSAPTNVWFTPNYYTPFTWSATGGCPDGRIGYSGAWNNYWGNFVRLPEVNCIGYDTIVLTFDISHSWFANQPNDWCRVYMWADNGYRHNIISVLVDSVDVTYNAGANGKGFKFSQLRNCSKVKVIFDISAISNKSNILLYIEPHCQYNNSNLFYVYLDNIGVQSHSDQTVSISNHQQYHQPQIFPTITDDMIFINLRNPDNNVVIRVYTIYGTKLMQTQLYSTNELIQIDLSMFPAGTYIVTITHQNEFFSAPILKK